MRERQSERQRQINREDADTPPKKKKKSMSERELPSANLICLHFRLLLRSPRPLPLNDTIYFLTTWDATAFFWGVIGKRTQCASSSREPAHRSHVHFAAVAEVSRSHQVQEAAVGGRETRHRFWELRGRLPPLGSQLPQHLHRFIIGCKRDKMTEVTPAEYQSVRR